MMHLFDSTEPKKMIIHSNMIKKKLKKNLVVDFDLVAWLWCVNDLITINNRFKKLLKSNYFLSTAGEGETPK